MFVVLNGNTDVFTLSEDLVFFGFIYDKSIGAGSYVGVLHLFDISFSLCLVSLSFIFLPGYLFTMNVLMPALN